VAPAVSCEGVWKSYRIYHQRSHTLKEKVLARRNRYEDFWALRGIDLEVSEGSTIGIIGPNGSGKSTLLKTMARILNPNKGTVKVNGTVSPLLELGTGFHPELTGRENVFLGCSLLGLGRRDVERRFDEIIDFAGVEQFVDSPVKNYSSGMYARLAFAVAISVEPEILIIDEVLAVGDEEFQMRCYKRMARLRTEGRTIVLVSHSLPTIQTMCSEAVWLDKGAIREIGSAPDVVASYLTDVHATVAAQQAEAEPVAGSRFGSGEAEIIEVSLLGPGGTASSTFRQGDELTIRIAYRTDGELDEMECGVAVFRADTLTLVFGHSTVGSPVDLSLSGECVVDYRLPSLPLLGGDYILSVALHDRSVARIYDFHDRRYAMAVLDEPGAPLQSGMVRVAADWTARASGVPLAQAGLADLAVQDLTLN